MASDTCNLWTYKGENMLLYLLNDNELGLFIGHNNNVEPEALDKSNQLIRVHPYKEARSPEAEEVL